MKRANRAKILVAYFNICILWGSSNLANKIGLSDMAPLQIACLRFLIAGLVLALITTLKKEWRKPSLKELKALCIVGILMQFLTNGCIVTSNTMIDSGVVTVMMGTSPIFATLIEVFITRKSAMGKGAVFGLVGGFCGILMVALYGRGSMGMNLRGVALALFSMVFWAAGSIYSKERLADSSVFTNTAIESLFAAMLFFITANMVGQFDSAAITVKSIMPVLYLAIMDSVIGTVSYIYLLGIYPAPKVCVYAYINPIVALILGYLFLGESITAGKVVGMIVIIISVIFIQKDQARIKAGINTNTEWLNEQAK